MTKKLFAAALALVLCLVLLTGCGSSNYIWTNEAGLRFDESDLTWEDIDPASMFDEHGYLVGVRGLDYVTLPDDIRNLSVPAQAVKLTDGDLENLLAEAMEAYAVAEELTDRAVAFGDYVNIDYVGTVNGVAFVGGDTEGMGTTVIAGSSDYVDNFLTQIIGHMPGETFDVVVTFPDNYGESTDAEGNAVLLSGQQAVFSTTINYIEGESTVPECTDEWVKENMSAYGFTTRQDVLDDLRAYYESYNVYDYVVAHLSDGAVFVDNDKLPKSMLNFAASNLLQMEAFYADYTGVSLSDYLAQQGYGSIYAFLDASADDILEDVRNLILTQALCETLEVQLSDDEVRLMMGDYYDSYIQQYGSNYTNMYANVSRCYSMLASEAVVEEA